MNTRELTYPDININRDYPEQVTSEYLEQVEGGVRDSAVTVALLGSAALSFRNNKLVSGVLAVAGAVKAVSAVARFSEAKQLAADHDFLQSPPYDSGVLL